MKKKKKMNRIFYGIVVGVALFLVLGIPTALLPSGIFKRMIMPTIFDYIFLLAVPILFGYFIYLYAEHRQTKKTCAAAGGVACGWVAVICPICTGFLVYVFGASVLLTYFEPLRPIFGILSMIVLVILILSQKSLLQNKK